MNEETQTLTIPCTPEEEKALQEAMNKYAIIRREFMVQAFTLFLQCMPEPDTLVLLKSPTGNEEHLSLPDIRHTLLIVFLKKINSCSDVFGSSTCYTTKKERNIMTTQKCNAMDCDTLCQTDVTQPDYSFCEKHVKPIREMDPNGDYIMTINADNSLSLEFHPSLRNLMIYQQDIYESFGDASMPKEEQVRLEAQLTYLEEVRRKIYGPI